MRQQLASYWHGFETDVYAEEVIARLAQDDVYFAVRNLVELAALHGLGGRSRIKLSAPLDPDDLRKTLIADRVTHIWVDGYTLVSDLGWLEALPSLRSVLLTDDQPIAPEDLRPLVPAHVEVAYAP
ncbi:hypothetical protein ACFW95_39215 [Streptomyces sp. NPDC059474]|uniref:hypothetical protein n=1 Tax=Streptomyces sp. NPDC059474 TaxID=3346846 RepID=UPI0036750781